MNPRRSPLVLAVAVLATLLATIGPAHAADPLPPDSVYHLTVALTDQTGATAAFAAGQGSVRIASMFYARCGYVCPLIVETIKRIEHALPPEERAALHVLLVTLDSERDDVATLARVAAERRLDPARWRLTRTDAGGVRTLAAVLGIQYRQLENREFNHSSALVLLDPQGRILARSSRLGDPEPEFVAAIRAALRAP